MNNNNVTNKMLEVQGSYKGHSFYVVLLDMGHRCGYVRAPGRNLEELECRLECHGGVTFTGTLKVGAREIPNCVGFDCAHSSDLPDIPATLEAFGDLENVVNRHNADGHVWTREEVIEECKIIIDQLEPMRVELPADQWRILLALLDCMTNEEEPDWFLDRETGMVSTPVEHPVVGKIPPRSLEEHLKRLLHEYNFPTIFGK